VRLTPHLGKYGLAASRRRYPRPPARTLGGLAEFRGISGTCPRTGPSLCHRTRPSDPRGRRNPGRRLSPLSLLLHDADLAPAPSPPAPTPPPTAPASFPTRRGFLQVAQVVECQNGVLEEHTPAGEAHDIAHRLARRLRVAVNPALPTRGLFLAIRAHEELVARVIEESVAAAA
jgi:hypothetical protein